VVIATSVNLAAAAEIYAILTNTIVYHDTCLRLTVLQKFCAVNIKIIWSQMYIFHLKEHLVNATVVTYYSLFIYVFSAIHMCLVSQFRIAALFSHNALA
jgi:hypothetical protein